MQGSTNTSFIPKHTPNKPERKGSPRQLFIGTLLVRILFFAVLISAIGVFFYEQRLSGQLKTEVDKFKAEASAYAEGEAKLEAVTTMDKRLAQAGMLFNSTVSLYALFEKIESETLQSVKFDTVEVSWPAADKISFVAQVTTDSFDATLFQRSVFEGEEVLKNALIENVEVTNGNTEQADPSAKTISFTANIDVAPEIIRAVLVTDQGPFVESEPIITPAAAEEVPVAPTEETAVDVGFSNE